MKEESYKRVQDAFKLITLQIVTVLLAVVLFFLLPTVFVVSIPLFAFRHLVKISSKWIRPDLGKMVTARGILFAIDSLYTKPKCSLVTSLVFEGTMDFERTTDLINQRLVQGKLSNGDLMYPELTQYLTQWLGFFFWKPDQNFDIRNHVSLHPEPQNPKVPYGKEDIQEIMEKLVQKPWTRKRPLWEFFIVHNCDLKNCQAEESSLSLDRQLQTVMLVSVHHTLADGYSLLSTFTKGLAGHSGKIKNAMPRVYKRNEFFSDVFYKATFPFRCTYEVAQAFVIPLVPWISIPFMAQQNSYSGQVFIDTTDRIPINRIKKISKHFDVRFSSVICASIAGGLRDFLINKGMKVPLVFPLIVPLPIPGHSEKLRNYMAAGVTNLPIWEKDAVKRVKYCSKDYERLRKSAFPAFATFYMPLLGLYFPCIATIFARNYFSSAWLTNFPGGLQSISIGGHKTLESMVVAGLEMGKTGIGFCAMSYLDGIRILQTTNSGVMTKQDLTDLTRLIQGHIDILHDQVLMDV